MLEIGGYFAVAVNCSLEYVHLKLKPNLSLFVGLDDDGDLKGNSGHDFHSFSFFPLIP